MNNHLKELVKSADKYTIIENPGSTYTVSIVIDRIVVDINYLSNKGLEELGMEVPRS